MLVDKQPYFENHHHQKIFDQENNLNICIFSIFSSLLIILRLTVLRSMFVTNFACFNLSSNIEPENVLAVKSLVVIYFSWSGILFSSSTIFVS